MRKQLILILAIIVILPMVVLIGFGVRLANREQERVENRYKKLLQERLQDVSGNIARLIQQQERELLQNLDVDSITTEQLRQRVRSRRLLRQIFVLGIDGHLLYPDHNATLSQREKNFLQRTAQLWDSGESFWSPPEVVLQANPINQRATSYSKSSYQRYASQQKAATTSFGWHTWFWGDGLHLIFWVRRPDGSIIGAEVERAALIADIIGHLPASGFNGSPLTDGRITLTDASGKTIYQWGHYVPPVKAAPAVSRPAPAPFSAWNFNYYVTQKATATKFGKSAIFNIATGLAALTLALTLLAIYFYRESSRDMREAAQRVTFVNQVSHELKTPLTNIRMYAELLEPQIPDDNQKAHNYIKILIAEAGRLSRLITNVLSFAKQQRNQLRLTPHPADLQRSINRVIDSFAPTLAKCGIMVDIKSEVQNRVMLDIDKFEQILGNLINNVEKYAKGATRLTITSRLENDCTILTITDDGPGIPAEKQEQIFQPFVRLSSKLTDGVSGTGIGLTIARQLAKLHGGDIRLRPTATGASFEVRLHTPPSIHT